MSGLCNSAETVPGDAKIALRDANLFIQNSLNGKRLNFATFFAPETVDLEKCGAGEIEIRPR